MPKVTFLPENKTVEAIKGESLLDIALDNDISIQHACGGFCSCTTCHCKVQSGMDQLTSPDEDEMDRMEMLADRDEKISRLACQARVNGDVTVMVVNTDD